MSLPFLHCVNREFGFNQSINQLVAKNVECKMDKHSGEQDSNAKKAPALL